VPATNSQLSKYNVKEEEEEEKELGRESQTGI
jgi:hypothetical protein